MVSSLSSRLPFASRFSRVSHASNTRRISCSRSRFFAPSFANPERASIIKMPFDVEVLALSIMIIQAGIPVPKNKFVGRLMIPLIYRFSIIFRLTASSSLPRNRTPFGNIQAPRPWELIDLIIWSKNA